MSRACQRGVLHRQLAPLLALALGAPAIGSCALSTPSPDRGASATVTPASVATGSVTPAAAAATFQRLAALHGDWFDAAAPAASDPVVTYRVTGAGSAVVETLFPGQAEEMVTVYHRDGEQLVLTHYCSGGNQPRMRATAVTERSVDFDFAGGANIDPARDMHMHSGRIEFVSADEIRATWQGWEHGRPAPGHLARFHVVRRAGRHAGPARPPS
jgi:hypothetical protein